METVQTPALHIRQTTVQSRVYTQVLEDEGITTTEWPSDACRKSNRTLWNNMFRSIQPHQVAPQTVQEFSDAGPDLGEDPQDIIYRLIRSMP